MKKAASLVNQLKWDLKFVLWALVAVVLLAPVNVWLELREFERFEVRESFGMAGSTWVWVLMMMVSVVALVLVIQKDVPAGPKEFWLSRPVSRGGMLGSKLVVFVLFLILLGGASLVAPLMSGEGANWGRFLLSFITMSAWILGLAVVLAAVSSGLQQVLSNALVVGGVALVVTFVRMSFMESGIYPRSTEVTGSASMVGWVVFLLGAVILVAGMYLTKSMRKGLPLLIGLFVIFGGVFQFWSINLVGERMSHREMEEGWDRVNLRLELREEDKETYRTGSSLGSVNDVRVTSVPSSALVENLPEGYSVRDVFFAGRFEVDGELAWKCPRGFSRVPTYLPNGEFENMEELQLSWFVRYGLYEGEDNLRVTHLNLGKVPVMELKKWRGKSLSYRGRARVQAVKTVQLARFPFGEDVLLDERGVRIKVDFKDPSETSLAFEIEGRSWFPKPFFTSLDFQGIRYFLVNEERNQFVEVRKEGGGGAPDGRFYSWRQEFYLTGPGGRALEKLADREEWLRESFVCLYAPIPQGEFVVPVELEDFRLGDVMESLD